MRWCYLLTEPCSINQKFVRYNVDCTTDHMGHVGPFTLFNYPTNQQFDKCKKTTYKFHHSTWVYQKSYSYGSQSPRNDENISTGYLSPSLIFPHFLIQKIKIPGDIIILHQCTKNHNHMIFNSQNMMWIALQVILGHLWL